MHTGPGDRQGITIHFNIIDTRMHQQKAKQPLETPKLHRCIELAHLFHSGFRIKVKELATKFSVCKRTIFRDIRTLENAGVPIQYNKKKGGHVIQSGFRLRISSLEDEDLSLLIAAICTSEMMCQPLTRGRLQSVMARLLNQCPAYLQDHLSNIANSCRQESLEKKTVIINPELFVNILHALGQRKKIRLRVSNLSETNSTIQIKVAPYYFVIAPDTWYLFGHSSWHRRALSFDLQDITLSEITEEKYEIPSVFIG